jgi:hypothetical protein
MSMLLTSTIIASILVAYAFIGAGVTAFVATYYNDKEHSTPGPIFAGLFWPIAFPFTVILVPIILWSYERTMTYLERPKIPRAVAVKRSVK